MGEAHGGFVLVILSCELCPWLNFDLWILNFDL